MSDHPFITKLISSSSAMIGMLPELPGYNGSVLMIDDDEANRIESDLDVAAGIASYMFEALDEIGGLSRELRRGGPDPADLQDLSDALEKAVDLAHAAIAKAKGETA